jgi:hypothetical protein
MEKIYPIFIGDILIDDEALDSVMHTLIRIVIRKLARCMMYSSGGCYRGQTHCTFNQESLECTMTKDMTLKQILNAVTVNQSGSLERKAIEIFLNAENDC